MKNQKKGGKKMSIIDYECLACSSFHECGTEVGKGSILCRSKLITNKQTKGDMLLKMCEIAKTAQTKDADVLEMLNIKK